MKTNMTRRTPQILAVLMLAVAAPFAFAADKPLATVNGQAISAAQADNLLRNQLARGAKDSPELRNAIQNQLISVELLAQEAKKRGLDKSQGVQLQLSMVTKEILSQAAIGDTLSKQPISEADIKNEYDQAVARGVIGKEYLVRHILVESEDEARSIIKKLGKGDKFADLAKGTKDVGSAANGGELGWNAPGNFVQPFAEAMTKLSKGQYSTEPVKTEFGYHVLQVEDARNPTFEQLKPQIYKFMVDQRVDALVRDLRSKAKIQ